MTVGPQLRALLPELGTLWARYEPRTWPSPESLWLNPVRRSLGLAPDGRERRSPSAILEPSLLGTLDDVLYVPPVAVGASASRDELVARGRELGVPMVVQVGWAEAAARDPEPGDESMTVVVDPMPLVVDQRLADLERLPAGNRLLFPLIGGLTSDPELWETVCARCAESGIVALYPVALGLDASERRLLAERLPSERSYRNLFHGEVPDPRAFAREAARQGLEVFPRRPLPPAPERLRARRFVAGQLATIAELWLALGRSEGAGQAFFRAARKIDEEDIDVAGSWREGNLGILDWLEGRPGEVVTELLSEGSSTLLAELERDYLEG